MKKICLYVFLTCLVLRGIGQRTNEQWRPQIHFSPEAHWMNDPNGLVYNRGIYHLFFQYYPGASVWGPMHWGHAVSNDMVHWKEEPIALYPDSLGYIFSGSAVVDKDNTSGFGKKGSPPLVAVFTQHDTAGEKAHRDDYQNQSIAYSLDNGKTWTKYSGNPVLKNPGIVDFRDPKVIWHEQTKKWIMTLATKDRITFYSSPDLKSWTKESEFGADLGAHGGVWECPDLLDIQGQWVLLVSINPGAPNGGSGTQYFTGTFDGHGFTADDTAQKWIDYGRDDYAGVTWSGLGDRRVFLGWMSNWWYGERVPTVLWRSANTLPRELGLQKVAGRSFLVSRPVKELDGLVDHTDTRRDIATASGYQYPMEVQAPFRLSLATDAVGDLSIELSNDAGEGVIVGYSKGTDRYRVDRSSSGRVDFDRRFAAKDCIAPRLSKEPTIGLSLYVDVSSLELFADGGLTVMSELVFPAKPYNRITVHSADGVVVKTLTISSMKGIWGKP